MSSSVTSPSHYHNDDFSDNEADGKRRSPSPSSSNENQASGSSEFANKFRRLRACARCHRLKMRCVFEDPGFERCSRCFKADLKCSMTEDPTVANARSRPRKRAKLKGTGPLANLQQAMNDASKLFQNLQKQVSEAKQTLADTPNTTVESIATNNNTISELPIMKVDTGLLDENLNPNTLTQLQLQLSELQRLLSHSITVSKENNTSTSDPSSNNVASSMNSMKDGPVKPVPNLPWIPYELNIIKELYKLKILDEEDTKKRFDLFINELLCFWPCASIPDYYTHDWLLENDPLVLLGFITVTCLNEPDLHDTLLYYLDGNLAQKVSITGDITVSLVHVYLVLSLWCSPPRKWGSYKHQMSLLTALNLVLCLDLGNESHRTNQNVLKDNSEERKIVRAYMGVYACCGSLGLSLPRFKVVTWTPSHERCCQILLMGESNRYDRFICYYARLVAIGEEIFQFLCPNITTQPPSNGQTGAISSTVNLSIPSATPSATSHPTSSSVSTESAPPTTASSTVSDTGNNSNIGEDCIIEPSGNDYGTWQTSSLPHESLRAMMISYERRMQKLATESKLLTPHSKERNLLSIIYYQLLMTMYDYVVCRVLLRRDILTEVYLQTLNRLIKASEKVIDSFVALCEQTSQFPTFFYYRPMHALVALIRARLLVKSQNLDLEIDVEQEYEKVSRALKLISTKSKVASKMSMILSRISKWMKVSNKFNKDGATNSMVDLLDELGKEKAVENIKITMKKREGDNGTLNPDSRIQFNKFINYSADSLAKGKRGESIGSKDPQTSHYNSQPTNIAGTTANTTANSTAVTPQMNNRQNRRPSTIFVPSPIGFTNSEVGESPRNSLEESHRPINEQYQEQQQFQNMQQQHVKSEDVPSTPNVREHRQQTQQKQHQQLQQQQQQQMFAPPPATPFGSVPPPPPQFGMGIGGMGPPLPGGFMFPQSRNGSSVMMDDQQIQQQNFLNDLFSQIDSDVMSSFDVNGGGNGNDNGSERIGSGQPTVGDFIPGGNGGNAGTVSNGPGDFGSIFGEDGYGFW